MTASRETQGGKSERAVLVAGHGQRNRRSEGRNPGLDTHERNPGVDGQSPGQGNGVLTCGVATVGVVAWWCHEFGVAAVDGAGVVVVVGAWTVGACAPAEWASGFGAAWQVTGHWTSQSLAASCLGRS